MITAAFLAVLALTVLGGARIATWIYGGRKNPDRDLRADEWWRP